MLLVNTTRVRTKEEIRASANRAQAHYFNSIKDKLSDADKGRYVAIDANTGEWEIDDTRNAVRRLRARVPDADIHTIAHITLVTAYLGSAPDEFAGLEFDQSQVERLLNEVKKHRR